MEAYMAKLTPKQQRFVDEYLLDLNATQASIRAGYSEKTAEQMGYQLLQKTLVKQAIEQAQAKRQERILVSQDDVIRGLLMEAEWQGEGASHSARVTAWTQLGKHLGMFNDKLRVEQSGESVLNIKVSYE